ncbi:MAG: hypothetical protein ACXAC5_12215 [Promethearchaeota archaeon]|jgi:hypothetical protein
MPYIMTFVKYPSYLAPVVAKRYLELLQQGPEADDSIGEAVIQSAAKITDEGIRILGVTRVNKGKLDEAWNAAIVARAFFMDIEGYEASIEVWATVEEGLQALGMKLP